MGAHLVISGEISIGQLIAFNMLAGQVIAPVIRLASSLAGFQQVGISVERLGDVLNTPVEKKSGRNILPEIQGISNLKMSDFGILLTVMFILNNINLYISKGMLSYSWPFWFRKKYINKLLQRFYIPETGQILIDGMIYHLQIQNGYDARLVLYCRKIYY